MIKYGTYVVFKCVNCEWEIEIPFHQKDSPQLEKYASYCTHEWEDITNAKANEKESTNV